MVQITKISDLQEYELNDFGEQKVKLHMGGKSTTEFAQNLNMRFDCHSGSEKFFLNCNRIGGVRGLEDFTPTKVAIEKTNISDSFEPIGDNKLRWLIKYKEDPRPTQSGDHVEEFELKFSNTIQFHKQPSTYQGFLDIEPGTVEPTDQSIYGSYAVKQTGLWGKCIDNIVDRNVIHDAGSGKLCHIYAKRLTDNNGQELWIEPDIVRDGLTAVLSYAIPQGFFLSAVYPLTFNATFGYGEGVLETEFNYLNIASAARSAPADNGTVVSIDIFSDESKLATNDVKVGIYNDDGGGTPAPSTLLGGSGGENESVDIGTWDHSGSPQWHSFTADALSVVNGTFYWLSVHSRSLANLLVQYDSNAGTNRYFNSHIYADAWPTTHGKDTYSGAAYSLRCVYTPDAGGTTYTLSMMNTKHFQKAQLPALSALWQLVVKSAKHFQKAVKTNVTIVVAGVIYTLVMKSAKHIHSSNKVGLQRLIDLSVKKAKHIQSAIKPVLSGTLGLVLKSAKHVHSSLKTGVQLLIDLAVKSVKHFHKSVKINMQGLIGLIVKSTKHVQSSGKFILTGIWGLAVKSAKHFQKAKKITITIAGLISGVVYRTASRAFNFFTKDSQHNFKTKSEGQSFDTKDS